MPPADPLDFLPSSEAVADDLDNIVVHLDRYKNLTLSSLRALPSIRKWRAGVRRLSERERSNFAMVAAISGAIDRIEDSRRAALEELFAFRHLRADLGTRQEAAARHLGISADAIRKGRQGKLLHELADEMLRGELAWCLDQLATAGRGPSTWYRTVEHELTLVVDPLRPSRQTWTARYLLESCAPDHPIVVLTQRWSGSGTEEPGEVTILSGPRPHPESEDGDPFRHRLVDVRPLQRAAEPYFAYIFDLGEVIPTGKTVELRYQQILDDVDGKFRPVIGLAAFGMPDIRLIRIRASIPDVDAAEAYKLVPTVPLSEHSAAALPQSYSTPTQVVEKRVIERDDDGFLTYDVTVDVPGHRYELWWQSST